MSLSKLYGIDEARGRQITLQQVSRQFPDAMVHFDRDVPAAGSNKNVTFFVDGDRLLANTRGDGWWQYDQTKQSWGKTEKPGLERGGVGRGGSSVNVMGLGSHMDIKHTRDEDNLGYETVRRAYGEEPFKRLREMGIDPEDCSYDKGDDYELVCQTWDQGHGALTWNERTGTWDDGEMQNFAAENEY